MRARKARLILVLVSLSICLSLMSSTYSRYVAGATGNFDVPFAKWQILVNTTDITDAASSSVTFTPTIEDNPHVKAGVVAPTSKGYFDVAIDPTNVEVSFSYSIALSIIDGSIPDLLMTKYAILPEGYIEGDPLTKTDIVANTISNNLNFDNVTPDFVFDDFTIRIFFEWYEGDGENMDDAADTTVGHTAASSNTTFTLEADITFEQIFE